MDVSVKKLFALCPANKAWGPEPINKSEINKAIQEARFFDPKTEPEGYIKTRKDHVERIAWFVKYGWTDPIQIDLFCYVGHIIIDGNHRACAAKFLKHKKIKAEISGAIDSLENCLMNKFNKKLKLAPQLVSTQKE